MERHIRDTREVLDFIAANPTRWHAVGRMAEELSAKGFTRLDEADEWKLEPGKAYYTVRNGSALIAFRLPGGKPTSFRAISAHTDSPAFKLKPNPADSSCGKCSTLNVEPYGGLLISTWFDRPLSIAGRVFVKEKGGNIVQKLVDFARDLVVMPSLAIHQNRQANDGWKISAQKECRPILSTSLEKGLFEKELGKLAGGPVLDSDLFLYSRTPASIWGLEDEFFSSPRIDDTLCAWAAWKALLETPSSPRIQMACLFDNEEVGSGSYQGALSDLLPNTLERIFESLGLTRSEMLRAQASSFILSADNGHSLHPSWTEKCDPTNRPFMNGGVILKYAANQKYTTDGASGAVARELLERRGIPYQTFANNSDVPGGSTLGNLSMRHVSVPTADVGVAQLAMHSSWETAGTKDTSHLLDFFKAFLEE